MGLSIFPSLLNYKLWPFSFQRTRRALWSGFFNINFPHIMTNFLYDYELNTKKHSSSNFMDWQRCHDGLLGSSRFATMWQKLSAPMDQLSATWHSAWWVLRRGGGPHHQLTCIPWKQVTDCYTYYFAVSISKGELTPSKYWRIQQPMTEIVEWSCRVFHSSSCHITY